MEERRIAIVFKDGKDLMMWSDNHLFGKLVKQQMRPMGDTWYEVYDNLDHYKYFHIENDDDVQKIYGYLFDEVVILNRLGYSEVLMKYLRSRVKED